MNRIASGCMISIYLIGGYIIGGGELFLLTLLYVLLPFFCIWFGESMGRITGLFGGAGMRPAITKESPGSLVTIMGWIILLLPLIGWLFGMI